MLAVEVGIVKLFIPEDVYKREGQWLLLVFLSC